MARRSQIAGWNADLGKWQTKPERREMAKFDINDNSFNSLVNVEKMDEKLAIQLLAKWTKNAIEDAKNSSLDADQYESLNDAEFYLDEIIDNIF